MCRDAIQFVHDQTVRLMNKGLAPREIAARVKLPPHLATHPYLIEYYGTVEWSGTGCHDSAGLLEHPVQCGRCTTATWAGSPGVLPSSTRCRSTRRPGGWCGWRGAGGGLTRVTYLGLAFTLRLHCWLSSSHMEIWVISHFQCCQHSSNTVS